MQPYFLPYLGYWQLIKCVDKFVVYDNIQYEKSGWMRRNRILVNGKDKMFTIPLKKDSDFLNVNERYLVDNAEKENHKIIKQIEMAYKKAPYFKDTFSNVEKIFNCKERNLFDFIYYSIENVMDMLSITTPLIISSSIDMDHSLKGKDKVMEICHNLGADEYVNPIGGINLYDKDEFRENGIDLYFLESRLPSYHQYDNVFVSGLSIIDILMFNSVNKIQQMLNEFDIK